MDIDFKKLAPWNWFKKEQEEQQSTASLPVQRNDLPRILDIAKKCGYDEEVESLTLGPRDNPTCEIRRLNKFQGEDHVMVDFVLVTSRLEAVWAGRVPYTWKSLTVPVVSAAGLAKMKRLASRPQDLVDIDTLGFKPDDPAIQP